MKKPTRQSSSPVRLVGYVRVSTEDQAEKGVSLAAQRKRLRAYCEAHEFDLVAIHVDAGVSGKTPPHRREGLGAALEAIREEKADGMVALKLDRLSRKTRDTLDLVEASQREGWRLLSVSEALDTGTAAGRMVVTILAALAQMEREQIGERTSMGMEQVAREGRARSHRLPFGYRVSGSKATTLTAGDRRPLVKDRKEQALLKRMLALREEGLGARRIARALNDDGKHNPRTGRAWNFGTVAAILRTASRRAEATS